MSAEKRKNDIPDDKDKDTSSTKKKRSTGPSCLSTINESATKGDPSARKLLDMVGPIHRSLLNIKTSTENSTATSKDLENDVEVLKSFETSLYEDTQTVRQAMRSIIKTAEVLKQQEQDAGLNEDDTDDPLEHDDRKDGTSDQHDDDARSEQEDKDGTSDQHDDDARSEQEDKDGTSDQHDDDARSEEEDKDGTSDQHDDDARSEQEDKDPTSDQHDDAAPSN